MMDRFELLIESSTSFTQPLQEVLLGFTAQLSFGAITPDVGPESAIWPMVRSSSFY